LCLNQNLVVISVLTGGAENAACFYYPPALRGPAIWRISQLSMDTIGVVGVEALEEPWRSVIRNRAVGTTNRSPSPRCGLCDCEEISSTSILAISMRESTARLAADELGRLDQRVEARHNPSAQNGLNMPHSGPGCRVDTDRPNRKRGFFSLYPVRSSGCSSSNVGRSILQTRRIQMPTHQTTLRDFLLPRSGPGTRTAWFVFFSTVATALAMCSVAMYSWYRDAQTQISKTHPVVLEWSAESVLRQLDRARDEIGEIAQATNPTSNNAALSAHLREIGTAESTFSGFVYLDNAGNVRASEGLGTGYGKLLKALDVKRATDAELSDVLAGDRLRRELSETKEPSLRTFARDDEHAWVIASAPLPGRRNHAKSTLHAVLRGERLAEQLHTDLLTVGGLYLVDSNGRVIAVAGDADSEYALPDEALRASTTPHLEVPWTAGGDWTVRSALLIDALDLTVAAKQPVLLAFKPMLVASSWILATAGLLIAASTLLACLSAMASTRRLQALLDGFRGLLDDDFETRLPLTRVRGQVEHLYRAFNSVAERISDLKGRSDTQIDALSNQNQRFQTLQEHLSKLSVTDGLTDLHNHRYFQDQLAKEIKRLARSNEGLSILILDIDDFKKLNDNYGHAAGDEFLKQLALILRESVRDTDVLARYGGEEFVVIATGTKIAGAQMLAEKLRMTIAETSFIVDETMRPRRVTVSIGVAEYGHSRTELFTSADAALYRAKNAGKNCVMLAESSDQL